MSYYTALGVTVSPAFAGRFVELLRTVPDPPNHLAEREGDITAIWEPRKHFDFGDPTYRAVMKFLDSLSTDHYVYEIYREDGKTDYCGSFDFGFGVERKYVLYGTPIDLAPPSKLLAFGKAIRGKTPKKDGKKIIRRKKK